MKIYKIKKLINGQTLLNSIDIIAKMPIKMN